MDSYTQSLESVRRDLGRLFQLWNQLPESSNGDIFAKFIILQIELISIHPFTDGNGRVARAFSESYLESKGFLPYTPYSTDHKRQYQEEMGKYTIISQTSSREAYLFFSGYVFNAYTNNVNEVLTSVELLQNSLEKISSNEDIDVIV